MWAHAPTHGITVKQVCITRSEFAQFCHAGTSAALPLAAEPQRFFALLSHCRDLKGPNIFLSGAGDVLVGDFGLATLREPGDEAKHDQSVVGTPHYLSPELVSGKHYSFETDIW